MDQEKRPLHNNYPRVARLLSGAVVSYGLIASHDAASAEEVTYPAIEQYVYEQSALLGDVDLQIAADDKPVAPPVIHPGSSSSSRGRSTGTTTTTGSPSTAPVVIYPGSTAGKAPAAEPLPATRADRPAPAVVIPGSGQAPALPPAETSQLPPATPPETAPAGSAAGQIETSAPPAPEPEPVPAPPPAPALEAAPPFNLADAFLPSDHLACPVGTDEGVQDGYFEGNLVKIRICNVQGFKVNVRIAANVDALVNDARAQGIELGGGAFRTMQDQIDTYNNNCDDTGCSPPTADPGWSKHQMGMAIDFSDSDGLITEHERASFQWLSANAANYGLINFDEEPWHWSVDGR